MDSAANTIAIGETFENGSLRVHRYQDTLKLWDLTNAGKRGKKVRYCYTSPAYARGTSDQDRAEVLEKMARALTAHSNYETATLFLDGLVAEFPELVRIESGEYRGVYVAPANFEKTTIRGKRVSVDLDHDSFLVACLQDTNNEPRIMNKGGKKNVAAFAEWLKVNRKSLATMDLRGVETSLAAAGIEYHHWYAVD